MSTLTPHRKISVGALAGGLSIILVWLIKAYGHQDMPAEVASGLTTVLTFVTSYIVPEADQQP